MGLGNDIYEQTSLTAFDTAAFDPFIDIQTLLPS